MTLDVKNGRYIITARKGKLVTNGIDICAKTVILAIDRARGDFFEIDESEVADGIFE